MSRGNHPLCPCGKELADECMCGRAPVLGSMRIEPAIGSAHGVQFAPVPPRLEDEPACDHTFYTFRGVEGTYRKCTKCGELASNQGEPK